MCVFFYVVICTGCSISFSFCLVDLFRIPGDINHSYAMPVTGSVALAVLSFCCCVEQAAKMIYLGWLRVSYKN